MEKETLILYWFLCYHQYCRVTPVIKQIKLVLMNFKITVFVMTTNHDKSFYFSQKCLSYTKAKLNFSCPFIRLGSLLFFLMQQTCIFKIQNPCFTCDFFLCRFNICGICNKQFYNLLRVLYQFNDINECAMF